MLLTIGLIIFLGMLSQWISWRLKIPVIIVLLLSGFLAGPLTGILTPQLFMSEELMFSIVELCVALILFDGAMQLKISEFKTVAGGLKRILSVGVLIHFTLITFASFFLLGDSLSFAALLGGILIVTGPTVVIPALREANINRKTAHYLKWEGIITDPIGAIIAIVIYDAMALSVVDGPNMVSISIIKILLIAFSFSFILKEIILYTFKNELLPEYLQLPFITSIVISSFVFSNEIQHGSGLLTVTLLGMIIGNSKINILFQLREFKENITTICISFVFILITSCTDLKSFAMITGPEIIFIILVSFVLRPLAILASTVKSSMELKEKLLIGFYGPRGIVAVSVAAAISAEMKKDGLTHYGNTLLPIVLLVVVTTVVVHSSYLKFLSKSLKLEREEGKGIVIIGTMPWVVDLAKKLQDLGIPVLVTSASWYKLSPFRKQGINTFYGQILSHLDREDMDLSEYSYLLAMSENTSFNALACEKFTGIFGSKKVFQLKQAKNTVHDIYNIDKNSYCVLLNNLDLKYENLLKYYQYGWAFKETRITKNYTHQDFLLDNGSSIVCMKINRQKQVEFGSHFKISPKDGDIIISFSAKNLDRKTTSPFLVKKAG